MHTRSTSPATDTAYLRLVIGAILGLCLIRLAGMILSPLGLHGDEAQYWAWSKELDWGYFTKPPMIAWVIFATTSIFGDAEWAVRLSSPLIHSATAFMIFLNGRLAYDTRTGFWAALIYLLMPALWLSSGIVSTDVPLLFFWSVALHAWLHMRETPNWGRAIQLGVALGLGLLSKYAMLFFCPALGLAILCDARTRTALLSAKGIVTASISLMIVTPNILWNLSHNFATFSHTAENANLENGPDFHPGELLTFWVDQLAVFGPVPLIVLVLALIKTLKRERGSISLLMAGFVLSPLLIISVEALISRANANWAVTAYIAAPILCAHYILSGVGRAKAWMRWGLWGQSLICAIFVIILLVPSWTSATGLTGSVKRLKAWPETIEAIEQAYLAGHDGQAFEGVAFDRRITLYDSVYYGLAKTAPIYMWARYAKPGHHADLTKPLPAMDGPVLIVNYYHPDVSPNQENYAEYFRQDFARLDRIGEINIDLGSGYVRTYILWAGYDYTPTTQR